MSGKVIQTLFIIIFIVIGTVQILSNNVTAIGEPVVNLRFDDGEAVQEASVGPGDPQAVIFHCTVSVQESIGSDVQGVYIELESSSEQGWESNVQPDIFYIYPGNSETFEVVVSIPFGTSSEIEDTITVSGYAENYPSGTGGTEITPIYGTIKIKPYYQFTLHHFNEQIKIKPGTEEQFEFLIENTGNAITRFSIEVEDFDKLEDKGYEIEFSHTTIVIPEKENRSIKVTIILPEHLMWLDEYYGFSYHIKIKVISEGQTNEEANHKYTSLNLLVFQDNIFLSYEFVISIIVIIAIVVSGIALWRFKKGKRS